MHSFFVFSRNPARLFRISAAGVPTARAHSPRTLQRPWAGQIRGASLPDMRESEMAASPKAPPASTCPRRRPCRIAFRARPRTSRKPSSSRPVRPRREAPSIAMAAIKSSIDAYRRQDVAMGDGAGQDSGGRPRATRGNQSIPPLSIHSFTLRHRSGWCDICTLSYALRVPWHGKKTQLRINTQGLRRIVHGQTSPGALQSARSIVQNARLEWLPRQKSLGAGAMPTLAWACKSSKQWVPLLACPAVPIYHGHNTAGQASSGTRNQGSFVATRLQ